MPAIGPLGYVLVVLVFLTFAALGAGFQLTWASLAGNTILQIVALAWIVVLLIFVIVRARRFRRMSSKRPVEELLAEFVDRQRESTRTTATPPESGGVAAGESSPEHVRDPTRTDGDQSPPLDTSGAGTKR